MESELIGLLRSQYSGKRILVVGLGIQGGGVGVTKFFAELGAQVTVTDLKDENVLADSIKQLQGLGIKYTLGEHKLEDFLKSDVIFKGPSVPWYTPEIIKAIRKGILVEMEVSFFASICPTSIIGVTGTRGKSTVSTIIYDVLREQGRSVYLAGNITQTSTINLLKDISKDDLVVLELSSWQLSGFHRKKLSPHISVFTNIYPDHLNFYKNIDDYLYDKKAIYLYQSENDFLIANEDLKTKIMADNPTSKVTFFSKDDFQDNFEYVMGEHNRDNAGAVMKVAEVLGLDLDKARKTIKKFTGLPYRQQKIKEKNKAIYINDTASTTPIATVVAIKTFRGHPIILILGGNAKDLPYVDLINELTHVSKIVLLSGSFTDQIMSQLKEKYPDKITEVYKDLKSAILKAQELAEKIGEKSYVLFSPGATSFSMFKNEFDRGNMFNSVVEEL